jgi:hypothetical protein
MNLNSIDYFISPTTLQTQTSANVHPLPQAQWLTPAEVQFLPLYGNHSKPAG